MYFPDMSKPVSYTHLQVKGIEQICAFIRQRFGDGMPLILTGDFNAQPDSRVIAVTNTLLQDARSAAKTTTDGITFHGFGEHTPKMCIRDSLSIKLRVFNSQVFCILK